MEASIHSIGINRLKSERAKKLFFVHYNKDEFSKSSELSRSLRRLSGTRAQKPTIELGITQSPPPPGQWDTDPQQRTEADSQVREIVVAKESPD